MRHQSDPPLRVECSRERTDRRARTGHRSPVPDYLGRGVRSPAKRLRLGGAALRRNRSTSQRSYTGPRQIETDCGEETDAVVEVVASSTNGSTGGGPGLA